jgi:hypothetical protein
MMQQPMSAIAMQRRAPATTETGVFIQPVDGDDQGESQLSRRAVHAARYDRNQRQLAEVFSDAAVHDPRNVVTEQRIAMLRKQAQSLVLHQVQIPCTLFIFNCVHPINAG